MPSAMHWYHLDPIGTNHGRKSGTAAPKCEGRPGEIPRRPFSFKCGAGPIPAGPGGGSTDPAPSET
jgi:hypothetical protein